MTPSHNQAARDFPGAKTTIKRLISEYAKELSEMSRERKEIRNAVYRKHGPVPNLAMLQVMALSMTDLGREGFLFQRLAELREIYRIMSAPKPRKDSPYSLERAKEYPIRDIVEVGRSGFANCVWHSEKSPSMRVYDDNHAYCFGCNRSGDSVAVYMAVTGKSFKETLTDIGI